MAERRMFAKTIIDSDAFLDMPMSTQALYFHLSMRADDDGFINNPKRIQRMIGASEDDLKLLIAKAFIITFDSGVVVIKHWKIHNYIQSDRYKPTVYAEEKALLDVKKNKAYTLNDECIQDVYITDTQDRLGKDRLGKDSIGKSIEGDKPPRDPKEVRHKYGEYKHVMLKDSDIEKLNNDIGVDLTQACITYLDEYIEMKGYKAKNHYLAIKKWVIDAVKERQAKKQNKPSSKAQELDDFYNMVSDWAESED